MSTAKLLLLDGTVRESAEKSCDFCCSSGCITGAKVGFSIALVVLGLLCIPFGGFAAKRPRTLAYMNAFAAGIFLSAGILHVLPHAAEFFSDEDEHGGHGGEHSLEGEEHDHEGEEHDHEGEEHDDEKHEDEEHDHEDEEHDHEDEEHDHEDEEHDHDEEKSGAGAEANSEEDHDDHDDHDEHSHGYAWANFVALMTFVLFLFVDRVLIGNSHFHEHTESKAPLTTANIEDGVEAETKEATEITPSEAEEGTKRPRALIIGLSVLIGIGFHAIFEAFAFGLSPSFSSALAIFIAIAAHRIPVCIAVYSRLLQSGMSKIMVLIFFVIYVMIFPIGAGIGSALGGISDTAEGIFVAIAAGTFIYLGAFDGLSHAFNEHSELTKKMSDRLFLFIAFTAGVALFAIIEGITVATGNTV